MGSAHPVTVTVTVTSLALVDLVSGADDVVTGIGELVIAAVAGLAVVVAMVVG